MNFFIFFYSRHDHFLRRDPIGRPEAFLHGDPEHAGSSCWRGDGAQCLRLHTVAHNYSGALTLSFKCVLLYTESFRSNAFVVFLSAGGSCADVEHPVQQGHLPRQKDRRSVRREGH